MLHKLLHRLRSQLQRKNTEREMDAELRFHLEMETAENIRRGMSEEEAQLAARRSFGGVEQTKEVYRDVSRFRWLEDFWQDLRYGVRMLAKRPGITLVIEMTLSLGIGANTAVFSLIDAFLLKLLPVKEPQQLVFVRAVQPNGRTTGGFPYSTFEQLRDRNRSFSGIFAWDSTRVSITVQGQPEMIWGDFVSGSYFDVLGVNAFLGRTFTAEDDKSGKDPMIVLNHNYWERRFGRDPAMIGKTIYVGKIPFTVIGVTSPGFFGLNVNGRSADVILPMFMQPRLALRDHNTFEIMARLKSGVSPEQGRADSDLIYQQTLTRESGSRTLVQTEAQGRARRIELKPGLRGTADIDNDFAEQLPVLLTVVGIVLLIACVNVANLLLARASARRKEIAVRLSLGAGRGRLVRQLLTESVLLAVLGGALGLIVALWGSRALLTVFSYGDDPIPFDLRLDARILAFTSAVSLLTGILFGLVPALAATRVDLTPVLKGVEGGDESRPVRRRLAKSLVVVQVALSLALLIGAGLLIRSLRELYAVDMGFERDKVLTTWVYPSLIGYDHAREMRLYQELLEKINALPGVQSASLSRRALTISKGGNIVGPRFFETLGIGLLQGRGFTTADTAASPKVAIISESLARNYFPNENPVDQFLPEEFANLGEDIQVVGVVRDTRHRLRQQEWNETVYVPYTQTPPQSLGQINLIIRTAGNPTGIVPVLRQQIQTVEKDLALLDIQTATEALSGFVGAERSLAMLLSFFGALALALAAIGLYGTMAYAVSRKTKELGIRLALGARKKDILRMVLREALLQVVIGVAIGIPVAMAATRLISSVLFGVKATDPVTIVLAVLVMLAVAAIAGYIPARRATKVDPMVALRYE